MYSIDSVEVEETIPFVYFACDLSVCKGTCCTLKGGKGAPLLDEEVALLEKYYSTVKQFLPKEHIDTIERHGLYEGTFGNYTTMCVNDRACVFVYYEQDVAKCSFELAYSKQLIEWQKPLSCHLFPIRVRKSLCDVLRYERISECEPALARGSVEQVPLYRFLKDSLTRLYGKQWYSKFLKMCEFVNSQRCKEVR